MQIALAWRVSPAALYDLDDATIATMILVLEEEAKQHE